MADIMAPPVDIAPLRSSPSHASFFDSSQAQPFALRRSQCSFSDLNDLRSSLSSSRTSSVQSTSASSFSLDLKSEDESTSSDDDEGLAFPAYGQADKTRHFLGDAPPSPLLATAPDPSPAPSEAPAPAPDHLPVSEDDTNLRPEPSQHVDYLSYDWKEEDIWSSWRHIVEHRSVYGERSRLENASWRQWTKLQYRLRTVSPESLNWFVNDTPAIAWNPA